MLSTFTVPEHAMQMSTGTQACSAAALGTRKWSVCLRAGTIGMLCAASTGCATTAPENVRDAQRLAEVSAIAGKPVPWFRYLSLNSYEPIGEGDVLVFTNPRQAWLLHLYGSCRDLDFGPFVGLTSSFGRVSAGIDKVIVRDNPIACLIQEIRPVDTSVLKHVERERRLQAQPPAGQSPAG
jgi:hypothetical protein